MEKLFEYMASRELITSLFVLLVAFIICNLIRRFFKKSMKVIFQEDKNASRRKMLINIIEHGLIYFVCIITLLIVLQINGINVTSLIASLGIASAIVGLALQDWLKDIIMGIHIVVDHFFDVDDIIEYEGKEGRVISFNVKTTKLRYIADNSIITISNRNISQIKTSSSELNMDVHFEYGVSADLSKEVMNTICARALELPIVKECVYFGIQEYSDSSVAHRIHVVSVDPITKYEARRKIHLIIREEFDKNKLSIPYKHLDVSVK
ncbi:MAG: mechanosensitive ion channel family protein [Clostridia bacterium]|nr:mechanosensitive ion channel family protein [Clostridia bacterium]